MEANLRTKIPEFRGLDSSIILTFRSGIIMCIRNIPRNFESTNLSRDNLSREIGRTREKIKEERWTSAIERAPDQYYKFAWAHLYTSWWSTRYVNVCNSIYNYHIYIYIYIYTYVYIHIHTCYWYMGGYIHSMGARDRKTKRRWTRCAALTNEIGTPDPNQSPR